MTVGMVGETGQSPERIYDHPNGCCKTTHVRWEVLHTCTFVRWSNIPWFPVIVTKIVHLELVNVYKILSKFRRKF